MKKMVLLVTAILLSAILAFAPALAEETPAPEATAEAVIDEAEGGDAEEENWASEAFGDLTGMKWYTAAILVVLLVMGVVLTRGRQKWSSRQISYAAMCIAIAFVLSCIKLFRMPQGGSVTPAAMLPLILFAICFGPVRGLAAGCAFGLLQLINGPYVIHPVQLLMDYPLAYGAMAVACLAMLLPERAARYRLPLAVLLGYAARLAMSTLSGVIFFAEYAGEQNVWIYSIGYNASYLVPEALIACALTFIPGMSQLTKRMHA